MKVLNLYAGVGGNRKLWNNVDVTAVELDPNIANVYHRLYPNDSMIICDAHQYLADHYNEFDFIWSSPPCQSHSRMNKATRHNMVRFIDGRLYEEIVFLESYFKGKFVVENVVPYYEPMRNPTRIGRHLFWSNFYIPQIDPPKQPENFINLATVAGKKSLMDWLGIHYEENIYYKGNHCPAQVLRNCVHPDIGLKIMKAARL